MAAATIPQRPIVEFNANVPEVVQLKYRQPKTVNTQRGARAMYSLTDGRVMFLDPAIAADISALNLERGERVRICFCKRKGEPTYWDIARADESRVRYASDEEVQAELPEMHMRGSAAMGSRAPQPERMQRTSAPAAAPSQTPQNHTADGSTPHTHLEDALKSVVAAVHHATEYAKSIGYTMPQFTGDELARMANTLIIEGARR